MNDILSEVKNKLAFETDWHKGIEKWDVQIDSEKFRSLIARIEELEAERRWIPVETIPATRNKGDYVKNCSEWFLLLFDDGEVCKGWYQDGVWYRRGHSNLAMPCDPTDYQAFPQEVKA